jgi:lipoprotein-anchoring transpeptidase ErfK/SrfK
MQRFIVTTLLLSVAGTVPALAQPNGYYYPQQQYAPRQYAPPQYAQPRYVQRQPQYVQPQPQYAQPEYEESPRGGSMGGGFIEFVFGGGQARPGRGQPQPVQQPAYVPAQQQQVYVQPQTMYGQPERVIQASLPPQRQMDPRFLKQEVEYHGKEAPGSIVINTPEKYLYLVQENGRALRYGVGVGKPGFSWAGTHEVTAKREWPDWRPPKEMLERRPDLPHYMAGGPDNPLGARAMYLGSTLYRIHGSNEPWTIGTSVSSGCIRMRNEDVIDLYERVKVGTKVTVI